MNWATPEPIIENAGMSIQNHHPCPVDLESAIAINKKATPVKMLLNARSSVGRLSCFRPQLDDSVSGSVTCGNWPFNACGTRLIFAPHDRQKLAPSRFCVAHFGQNIYSSPFIFLRPTFSVASPRKE